MEIKIHPHCLARIQERGTTIGEVEQTILTGEQFPAKYGRTGFRKNFIYEQEWNRKFYRNKQVEAFAVQENNEWLVITVITHYF